MFGEISLFQANKIIRGYRWRSSGLPPPTQLAASRMLESAEILRKADWQGEMAATFGLGSTLRPRRVTAKCGEN